MHIRFNGFLEPNGLVFNGASVKVDPLRSNPNTCALLKNVSNASKQAIVHVYNDVLYTSKQKTTEISKNRSYPDGLGNVINEYVLTVSANSEYRLWEGADATWVILKESPDICILVAIDGSGSENIDYKKHTLYLTESLKLVGQNLKGTFKCTYCSLDKPFDISQIAGLVDITNLQISGCRDIYGDIDVLRGFNNLTQLQFYASYSNISGSLDAFLDAVGAALVAEGSITGSYLDKSYGFNYTQVTVKGVQYTVRPTIRFYPDGTWEVITN